MVHQHIKVSFSKSSLEISFIDRRRNGKNKDLPIFVETLGKFNQEVNQSTSLEVRNMKSCTNFCDVPKCCIHTSSVSPSTPLVFKKKNSIVVKPYSRDVTQ